jgi:TolB-like protein/Tfp pilus assembly protein PilF
MARTLRLNLLGRFEARWPDGRTVDLAAKKAQALLAYLAVECGRAHTRDHLATLLWADTGEERARHNLRQALSKIRQCCDSAVICRGDTVAIDPASCVADVAEFERLAKSDDPDELRGCLGLYRGDLLDGLNLREETYEEWLLPARGRLRRIACQAAECLASSLVAHDRFEEAIEALNNRLVMDPACEPAHRDLMGLLARVGRRSDALRQYQSCADALERGFGTQPGPETAALYESLQKGEAGRPEEEVTPHVPLSSQPKHDRPTIAVLPFENISGSEDGYFVDGIVEEIITALSHFNSLLVIARGSSFAFRDRNVPEREIASDLGAQFLVRGSVQRAGQRVRINVQLLDAIAGLHLWGRRFDREMEDVFIVQDEIASTVVSTLAGRVEAARLALARKAPVERLEAYDFLLRGKEHHYRNTAEDCHKSIAMLRRAIERDPNYAVAHAWLACGLGQAIAFRPGERDNLEDQAQAAAERGLELDENDSECHRILAQVFLTKCDFKRSLWHQERALFLNPNDDRSVCAMGEILGFMGRQREAEEWVRRAMRLNPYHPERYRTHLARALFHQERFEDALEALEHLGRPRRDDLVYRIAAAARLGDEEGVERSVAALQKLSTAFEPVAFVQSLPYEHESDRQAILEAFEAAKIQF